MIKNLFSYWTLQLFKPQAAIRKKYHRFQSLLEKDKQAHELMAELEDIFYHQKPVDINRIENTYARFSTAVGQMIEDLLAICPGKYTALNAHFKKFDDYIRFFLASDKGSTAPPYGVAVDDPGALDESLVGGKAANLARASRHLGLRVPIGFAITTHAFNRLIEDNHLRDRIDAHLTGLDLESAASVTAVSDAIMTAIRDAEVPDDVAAAIHAELERCWGERVEDVRLAVRSSAKGEDGGVSFAGQYRTVLDVAAGDIISAYKRVIVSKYAPAALVYRINHGLADREVPMAVLVMEMIPAAASGVMVTREPGDEKEDRLAIFAVWGLPQALVDGRLVPEMIRISKTDAPAIVSQRRHRQGRRRWLSDKQGLITQPLAADQQSRSPIRASTALALTRWGLALERHFGSAQDVEWCLGDDDRLFLLQSRPLTGQWSDPMTGQTVCRYDSVENEILARGGQVAAGGIAAGRIVNIQTVSDLANIPDGTVLVSSSIPPDFAVAVNRLHAVVAETGSAAGHFASVAREFGIPTLVNLPDVKKRLPEGIEVTVNAENRTVYRGIVESMLDSPCARRNLLADTPFMRRFKAVMGFVSPLELVDPAQANFTPHGCRSHHDIIRFVHEKAVSEMFELSNIRFRKVGGSKKLSIDIPMHVYVIDVGGGFAAGCEARSSVTLNDIASAPLRALFDGLRHPDIEWGAFSHYDWASHDKVVMSGGFASADSAMFASHAIVSDTYANVNFRFGYHFVVIDARCGETTADNHILLRFSGGGADLEKRLLRAAFLERVFVRLGFSVARKSDLIDAQYRGATMDEVAHALDMVGRLLGASRLMDMYLKDDAMVDAYVDDFIEGRYHFSNVAL